MSNIDLAEAIQIIKDVGLNVYTPRTKDSGFIKIYKEPIREILSKLSGNSLKVLMALSCELEWNEAEVIITIDQLIEITGLERKTIAACLKELEKHLLVKKLGPSIRRSYVLSDCYVRIGKNE